MIFQYGIIKLDGQEVIIVLVARKAFTSMAIKNELLGYFKTMGHGKPALLCCMEKGQTPLYYGDHQLVEQAKHLDINKMVWQRIIL